MHLKRNKVAGFWSIPRKGTKYLAVATHNSRDSMPLIVILRDIFKLVKTKKELKKIINERQIEINHKEVREVNYPVCLFDIITLKNIKKNYQAVLSKNKKMIFEEVSGKDSEIKPFKIIGKKMLGKKKIQLNLMYGKNIISKEKSSVGDSVLFNLKENKVDKMIPMEKGKKVFIIKGKHMGHSGKIEEILERGGKKLAKISSDKGKINVWTKNIVVVG